MTIKIFILYIGIFTNVMINLRSLTNYGINFTSAIQLENVYGVQFHPERSHNIGVRLLKTLLIFSNGKIMLKKD